MMLYLTHRLKGLYLVNTCQLHLMKNGYDESDREEYAEGDAETEEGHYGPEHVDFRRI